MGKVRLHYLTLQNRVVPQLCLQESHGLVHHVHTGYSWYQGTTSSAQYKVFSSSAHIDVASQLTFLSSYSFIWLRICCFFSSCSFDMMDIVGLNIAHQLYFIHGRSRGVSSCRCYNICTTAYSEPSMAAVIVHGGAYAIPDSIAEASLKGCQSAAKLAHRALLEGKSALDAGIDMHW